MNPFSNMTRASWLATFALAAAAVAYMLLLFVPNMKSIRGTLAEIETKQSYILAAQQSLHVAERLRGDVASTDQYVVKQREQLLDPNGLPALYSEISRIAKDHALRTTKFEPKPAVGYDSFEKIAIGLGVSGSFADIHAAIGDLEDLKQQIWVDDVGMHGSREAGKSVECEMTLVVFVDNPEKTD
jgi:Tfp pilus assembly protein PilO